MAAYTADQLREEINNHEQEEDQDNFKKNYIVNIFNKDGDKGI